MIAVFETASLFTALVGIHVIWFRVRRPREEIRALLCFFTFGFAILLGFLAPPGWWLMRVPTPDGGGQPLVLTSVVLYLALTLSYLAAYPGYAVVGTSAKIMMLIANHPDGVQSYADLRAVLTDKELILPRLNDLVSAGLVSVDGAHYRLLHRGTLLAQIASTYRRLLRKGLGG